MAPARRTQRKRPVPPRYLCEGGPLDGLVVSMEHCGKDEAGNYRGPDPSFVMDRRLRTRYVFDGRVYVFQDAETSG